MFIGTIVDFVNHKRLTFEHYQIISQEDEVIT